jgi:hypothetical protein
MKTTDWLVESEVMDQRLLEGHASELHKSLLSHKPASTFSIHAGVLKQFHPVLGNPTGALKSWLACIQEDAKMSAHPQKGTLN